MDKVIAYACGACRQLFMYNTRNSMCIDCNIRYRVPQSEWEITAEHIRDGVEAFSPSYSPLNVTHQGGEDDETDNVG